MVTALRKEMLFVYILVLLTGILTAYSQDIGSGSGNDTDNELIEMSSDELIYPTMSISDDSSIVTTSVTQSSPQFTITSVSPTNMDTSSLSLLQSIVSSEFIIDSQTISIDFITSTTMMTSSYDSSLLMTVDSSTVIPFTTSTNATVPVTTSMVEVSVTSSAVVPVTSSMDEVPVNSSVMVSVITSMVEVSVTSSAVVPVTSSMDEVPVNSSVMVSVTTSMVEVSVTSSAVVPVTSSMDEVPVNSSVMVSVITSMVEVPTTSSVMVAVTSTITNQLTTSVISTASSSTITPTATGGTDIFDQFQEFFQNSTITLVVAIGGSLIVILLVAIIIFCCCCFCRRRNGRYSVEGEYKNSSSEERVTGSHYRRHPTISDPIPSYKMALRNVQEQRQQIDDFVETELGPDSSVDDNIHYRGHSQVQHSQPYSPLSETGTTQSLSKLTPFNTSQIMSQARGGISVDDIEEEIPEKDHYKHKGSRDDGDGADSPFMHLSDNLPGSRGRVSQHSTSDPHTDLIGQPSQVSQYSHLGLGVLHGGDVVFTNTASLVDDIHSSLGMIGIDTSLLMSKESVHSHRTASPLLHDISGADLDDTPVREKSVDDPRRTLKHDSENKQKNLVSLTSLTSVKPTKLSRSSTPPIDGVSRGPVKTLNLSSITALSTSGDERAFTRSATIDNNNSDLQETPERHRRHTVESSAFKRPPSSKSQSKLGKLTSLEYIRASLRMKLNRIKGNETTDNDTRKKPLKSALRKPSVIALTNSQNSSPDSVNSSRNNSFVYSNRHAHTHYTDMSPQHQLPSPQYYHPPDPYMRSPNPDDYPPLMGPDGYGQVPGMYPPGPGYPRGDSYMMGLSPQGYAPELLSPILSVSQFDHPGMYSHEIGILPQYGGMGGTMMGGGYHDQAFPPHPPHYDDYDDDGIPALHSPYRHGDQGGGASQRNVTWNLEPVTVEIPVDPENLTPSDMADDDF